MSDEQKQEGKGRDVDSGASQPLSDALTEFALAEYEARMFAELAEAVRNLALRAGYRAHVNTNDRRITITKGTDRG